MTDSRNKQLFTIQVGEESVEYAGILIPNTEEIHLTAWLATRTMICV